MKNEKPLFKQIFKNVNMNGTFFEVINDIAFWIGVFVVGCMVFSYIIN